jgi:radical SAM enzyme (TIGR01210 family)
LSLSYPAGKAQRDGWIVGHRPARKTLDPNRPYAFLVEDECSSAGIPSPVATIFLTNRECPWRCLMCDLWRNTLTETVPVGAIPAQIDYALSRLPPARQIKLYNSGSFFDRAAIPPEDDPHIAHRVRSFERVIVECHPALVGDRCVRFRDLLTGRLEVAMGLETVDDKVLSRLNKGMTLEQFAKSADLLMRNGIDLRVFILVKPPFTDEVDALEWAKRSLDFAFHCGATAASLIPTRAGNGAMEALAAEGQFAPPRMATLEGALEYGLRLKRGRVFADLWEPQFSDPCASCQAARVARVQDMNLRQTVLDPVLCGECGGKA